jgi:hypothetical protein
MSSTAPLPPREQLYNRSAVINNNKYKQFASGGQRGRREEGSLKRSLRRRKEGESPGDFLLRLLLG